MFVSDCMHCRKQPVIIEMHGMFYAQCSCGKWNPYEFVGVKKSAAITQWNAFNNVPPPEISPHIYKFYKRSHFTYYKDGVKTNLTELAQYLDVPDRYIRHRFCQKKIIDGSIVMKGVKISRKVRKENA